MAPTEAGSLSALNLLAANPPRYPVNPTEEPREPLTLYISRVPGTRDVILSTLKPQRKNVTYEDVANALYYVHLDLPSDELLLQAATSAQPAVQPLAPLIPAASSTTSSPTTREPLARKPVPGSHAPRTDSLPSYSQTYPTNPPPSNYTPTTTAAPPPPPPHAQLPSQTPASPPRAPQPWIPPGFRLDEHHSFETVAPAQDVPSAPPVQPIAGTPTTLPIRSRPLPSNSGTGNPMVAPIARKPVAFVDRPQDKALPQPPGAYPVTPTPPVAAAAPPPKPPQQPVQHPVQALPGPPLPQRPPLLSTPSSVPGGFVPFQLTLIRRDPSSNHQWNIGKIASVQHVEQPSQGTSPTAEGDPPEPSIRILLETSGYAKFRNDDLVGRGGAFARQVSMAYTKSWTAGIRNAFKRPSSHSHERSTSDGGQDGAWDEEPRRFLRPRNNSLAGEERQSKELSREKDTPVTRPGPGLKPKGYTFASPWDGRCEFRTGNGGRSLKCRHILHPSTDATTGATGGGVAGYNPLVIAQSIRDGQGLAAVASAASGGDGRAGRARATSLSSALSGAVAVSELRFNLPHGEVFRKPDHDDNRGELYGRFQDHLHQLQARHARRGSSTTEDDDDYDEDEEEMDLRLGRERAGGGNRGKRAKLGKLIVYDDGFKMLDLVVAANMGVWWVSWERSF
ncbi:hypothetical protein SEUCBS140593_007985 [Sporothrix eucalyptigena]|uniref:Oxidoreductase-like protein n=1 Tax=Sporothrix eucalyptigena TaxID=1812306 RepID=A0ABP0CHP6_9PEZI